MGHNWLQYRHGLRGVAYLRMISGERQRPLGQPRARRPSANQRAPQGADRGLIGRPPTDSGDREPFPTARDHATRVVAPFCAAWFGLGGSVCLDLDRGPRLRQSRVMARWIVVAMTIGILVAASPADASAPVPGGIYRGHSRLGHGY